MHSMFSRGWGRVMLLLAGVALATIGNATYASAGASRTVNAAPSPTTPPGTSSPSTSGSASPSGSATGTAEATVATRTGPMGKFLVDGQGRSLYLFLADTGTTSHCSGACAQAWPPLTTSGRPEADSGVTPNTLGTTTRSDGTKQVTYNGHPLYRFATDEKAGDTKGQGVNAFGALWWLVSPDGNAITSTSSGSAPATPSGSRSPG